MANVPAALKRDLEGRDTTPLGEGALVRLQAISMAPGIAKNRRLVVMEDGRYYFAQNSRAAGDRAAVYNVPLPEEPTLMLPGAVVAGIIATLDEVRFFDETPFVAQQGVRDGSLSIVTARRNGREHEVWYLNAGNALTDLLQGLADATGEQSSWADLLEEQLTLRGKLEER